MVLASASAFMCATISTSPEAASVATQVTRPSAPNFGVSAAPSSRSATVPGGAKGVLSGIATLQFAAWFGMARSAGTLAAAGPYLYSLSVRQHSKSEPRIYHDQ